MSNKTILTLLGTFIGLTGIALLWYETSFLIVLAVFLMMFGDNITKAADKC